MKQALAFIGFWLSLSAAAFELVALGQPAGLAPFAVLYLIGAAFGLAAPESESEPSSRARLERLATIGAIYAALAIAALVSPALPDGGGILPWTSNGLLAFQALFLARPGPGGARVLLGSMIATAQAVALAPYLAAPALALNTLLVVAYLAADAHERRRMPLEPSLALAVPLGLALLVGPVTLALPPAPPPPGAAAVAGPAGDVPISQVQAVIAEALAWTGLGLLVLALLHRFLPKPEGGAAADQDELVVAEVDAPRALGRAPHRADATGARGRVLATLARFLSRLRAHGVVRAPSATLLELARRLPSPAVRLARLFGKALWSDQEVTDADAESAERDAEDVLGVLRGRS